MDRYTPEVGRKFYADGRVRQFAGNTIICHLDPTSEIFKAALVTQAALRDTGYGRKFALLPPESLHMTVIELLCDETRRPEKWSSRLELTASLNETDEFFLKTVPPITKPAAFEMRPETISTHNMLIRLSPCDAATAENLRHYRDAVAAATGVRFPNHDSYGFHISLAYRLIELDADEQAQFERDCAEWGTTLRQAVPSFRLGPPELVFFDHMFCFAPDSARLALLSRVVAPQ